MSRRILQPIISYFDLSRRIESADSTAIQDEALDERLVVGGLLHDLNPLGPSTSAGRGSGRAASDKIGGVYDMPWWEQTLMYLAVLVGVVGSSAVMDLRSGGTIKYPSDLGTIAVSVIVSFVIIPLAYEKLQPSSRAPLIVRMGLFVQHGVFWQVLLGTIGKKVGI